MNQDLDLNQSTQDPAANQNPNNTPQSQGISGSIPLGTNTIKGGMSLYGQGFDTYEEETSIIPETPKPIETIQAPEAYKAPVQPSPIPEEKPIQGTPTPVPVEKKPNVVDKTGEPIKPHRVDAKADNFTKWADKDEQEFITGIASHHGHK